MALEQTKAMETPHAVLTLYNDNCITAMHEAPGCMCECACDGGRGKFFL
jgi:hypothetical protein